MATGTHFQSPQVFVVAADAESRDSLRRLLESAAHRVTCFDTSERFLAAFHAEQHACLVLDCEPGGSGSELQEELRRRNWQIPLIIIAAHATVPSVVNAIKKGAFDFVEKPVPDDALLDAVAKALAADAAARRLRVRRVALEARLAGLSARERQVMDRVLAGKVNKVIAGELGVTVKTVEAHRARVMHKLGVSSVAELVKLALDAKAPGQASTDKH